MRAFLHLLACLVVLHCALSVPVDIKKEDKSLEVTGRASMLGRFEPIVNSVVVPFLVATGVVSLVRMVPGVVSSLPGMLGFAKRTGYEGVGGIGGEQVPKEFYDIMTMLDNAAIRYGQPSADPTVAASQRQPVASVSQAYPYQAYQAYLAQQAQAQAAQAAQAQAAQAAQVSQAQKAQATARQHQG